MRVFVLTATCTVVLAATPGAQSADQLFRSFSDAVHDYQHGNVERAVGLLAAWPRRDLERVTSAVIGGGDWRLVQAAAMIHTELALRATPGNTAAATLHLNLAETLVRANAYVSASEFRRHWYIAAAGILLSRTLPTAARSLVDRGLRSFPRDASLHMLAGTTEETLAHFEDPECTGPGCDDRGPRSRAPQMLVRAESEYRRALQLDEQLAEARLRLGRVLFLANQRSRAREELTVVAQRPADPGIHYLTHLFLGGVAAYENDFAGARREYETAMSLLPEHQTAYVALGFAEQMTGALARSRETVSTMATRLRTARSDPWLAYQNGGEVNADSLEWLRKEAQR